MKSPDFTIVTFYFNSFDTIQIVQHLRGVSEWLADVGGSLGLYLGASMFTVIEILGLLVVLARSAVKKMTRAREKHKDKEAESEL